MNLHVNTIKQRFCDWSCRNVAVFSQNLEHWQDQHDAARLICPCPTGSSNGSPSGQLGAARCMGEGQRLQHRLSVGPQPGLQEKCRPGRGQGQGLRAGAGVCVLVCAWMVWSHVPWTVFPCPAECGEAHERCPPVHYETGKELFFPTPNIQCLHKIHRFSIDVHS